MLWIFSKKEAWLNAVVLVELAERARKGTNPLSGMASFYAAARGSIYQTGRFWKAEDDAKRTGSVSPF
jgi:hypothetical protein